MIVSRTTAVRWTSEDTRIMVSLIYYRVWAFLWLENLHCLRHRVAFWFVLCFCLADACKLLGFDVSYSCCVVWGKKSIAWFIHDCSQFLHVLAFAVNWHGWCHFVSKFCVFFSLSFIFPAFFFIYLIFSLFSRPHTGSCVLCQCALVVEHAIAYPNDTVQYPSLIRAFDVDQPLSCCILSLEEEQAMPVCPVELWPDPLFVGDAFLSLHLTPSLCHLQLISFTYSFLI